MFVGLGVSGVIPVLHGLTREGYAAIDARMGLSWVLLQGFLYIFGAFLYAVSHHAPDLASPFNLD
jgi:adiponectin receptor